MWRNTCTRVVTCVICRCSHDQWRGRLLVSALAGPTNRGLICLSTHGMLWPIMPLRVWSRGHARNLDWPYHGKILILQDNAWQPICTCIMHARKAGPGLRSCWHGEKWRPKTRINIFWIDRSTAAVDPHVASHCSTLYLKVLDLMIDPWLHSSRQPFTALSMSVMSGWLLKVRPN